MSTDSEIHYVGSESVDMLLHLGYIMLVLGLQTCCSTSDTLCWYWVCRHVAPLGNIMLVLGRTNIMYPSGATCLQAQNQHNVSEWSNMSTGSEPT
jgi:hypothetical protein